MKQIRSLHSKKEILLNYMEGLQKMREAQRNYFAAKKAGNHMAARNFFYDAVRLEERVDKWLPKIVNLINEPDQTTIFNDERSKTIDETGEGSPQ